MIPIQHYQILTSYNDNNGGISDIADYDDTETN